MIYTSYYAKLKKLPNTIIPIGISIGKPKGINILWYPKLQPTHKILYKYKLDKNEAEYEKEYVKCILSTLHPNTVKNELMELSNGNDVCLMCYEKGFCHRRIVTKWLQEHGIPCEEYQWSD